MASAARRHGNHPFGAVLVREGEIVLRAENTVVTDRDPSGHAETNLVRMAGKRFGPVELAECTLYTSTEPCPMCAGAIYWAGIRRVIYSMSARALGEFAGPSLLAECKLVFEAGFEPTEVIGPILAEEGKKVHEAFWS